MTALRRRTFLLGGLAAMASAALPWGSARAEKPVAPEILTLQLDWLPQAQFAGYIVAQETGLFRERGIEVKLLPGGPGHPAAMKVAAGAADVGIGPSSQMFAARAHSIPLKIIALPLQDSIFRFVLKLENRILSLRQLAGKPIGLWLGGDESEFRAMAIKQGMTLDDFQVVKQDGTLTGFLEDRYTLSQVSVLNELILLRSRGFPEAELQILSPSDYGVAMPSDCLFTSDKVLAARRKSLVGFLDGAREGWRAAFANKEETVKLLVSRYPGLDAGHQTEQLKAMQPLVFGPGADVPFGTMNPIRMEQVQQEMVTADLLPGPLFLNDIVDGSLLRDLPAERH